MQAARFNPFNAYWSVKLFHLFFSFCSVCILTQETKREDVYMKIWAGLVLWLLISLSAGFAGSQFAPGDWYASLEKPAWNPPNSIFAPVWTALYILMGVSAWFVWREKGFSGAAPALTLFFVQLVFNALWSYLFFGRHLPGIAFFEIIIMLLLIMITMFLFWRVRVIAGALLIPYLCWVGFASFLNYTLWRLNM
jgi:benzodiazapine receptor